VSESKLSAISVTFTISMPDEHFLNSTEVQLYDESAEFDEEVMDGAQAIVNRLRERHPGRVIRWELAGDWGS
jgi:hypothetical protein